MRVIQKGIFLTILTVTSSLWTVLATALESDRSQPIQISADAVSIDQKKGVNRYSGNVVLTQGTLVITANEVTVRYRAGEIEKVKANGNPVTFKERLDNHAEDISASAKRLEYNALKSEIDLFEQVSVSQGSDEFHSAVLHYNLKDGTLAAEGEKSADGQSPKERVQSILQPRKPIKTPTPIENPQTNP